MNLFEIITSVDWELWQGILDVIMTFLGIFTYKKYRNFIFRLVLGFGKRKECIVSLPAHHAKVLNRDRELIIKEEAQPCFKLVNHLNAAGIKVNFSQSEIESTNNEIHIGGPASNPHTNRYFCRYFQNIKWQATESHVALYKSDPTLRMFNFDYIQISEDTREGFLVDGKLLEYMRDKEGYAFIVRIHITDEDTPKTVHLLFGCGTNGTAGAINYFMRNYQSILQTKGAKKDYICSFKVDRFGNKTGKITWYDTERFISH